jgi:hypothetical protein
MKFFSSSLVFVTLFLLSSQAYAQELSSLTYRFFDGECDRQIVKLVKGPGLKLVFTTNDDMPVLTDAGYKGASLSNDVEFTKEGNAGWDMFMSTNPAKYTYKNTSSTLENLWLKRKSNRDNAPVTSAFYLSGEKCLVSTVPMKIPSR